MSVMELKEIDTLQDLKVWVEENMPKTSMEERECEICKSNSWRILHAGDESNCECEGECLRVCDNPLLEDGCDGVAILIERKGE